MKTAVVLVASLGVVAAMPAFAGNGHKVQKSVEAPKSVAASARTTEYRFDLDKKDPVKAQVPAQDLNELFAVGNEVALEDYSFDLK